MCVRLRGAVQTLQKDVRVGIHPSKKVPRKNRDVFRGASLGVFRAFFENEKRSKTLKDAQKREK